MPSLQNVVVAFLVLFMGNSCLSFNRILAKGHLQRRPLEHRESVDFLSATALHSTIDAPDKASATIKLPIIQIFKTKAITGEFVCGNEMTVSIDQFQNTLRSLQENTQASSSSGNYGVSNVYSEDQLENILSSTQDYVVLKLFRVGCKKCEKLEPIFDGLARDPVYSKFQFLQADVAYVETYKKNLKERLMGLRGG